MKHLIFLISSILISTSSFSQVSRAFNFNTNTNVKSGAYIEKHPTETSYFVASNRLTQSISYPTTVVNKLDANGYTQWYTNIPHPGFTGSISFLNDIKVNQNNIFVSSFLFASGSAARIRIYKLDFNGVVLDSVEFSDAGGLKRIASELAFDQDGNLFSSYRTNGNDVHFIKLDPSTLAILSNTVIGSSNLTNNQSFRHQFARFDGTHSVVAFNVTDSTRFVKFSNLGTIVSQFSIYSPDGEMTDFEVNGTNYSLLINKEFGPSTPTDNPIRITEITNTGTIVSDNTYITNNSAQFTNLAINGTDFYVCSRTQYNAFKFGGIYKINSALELESKFIESEFSEIEIYNNQVLVTGNEKDELNLCYLGSNAGNVFVKFELNESPITEVVSPHMDLQLNNITATIGHDAANFRNPQSSQPGYNINGAGHLIYNTNLLLAGQDGGSNIRRVGTEFYSAFASGPITNQVDYTNVEKDKWERVWIITREMIDNHIAAFQAASTSYNTPEVILNWPGNGEVTKGQNLQLARFQDINNNGVYEPLQGEYPNIKGDFCALSIYNSVNIDLEENCYLESEKLDVQVFEYVYGFDCDQDSSLQNTTYVFYEIINGGGENITDTYVGHFVDFDIIMSNDDFIATDPSRSMAYAYEGFTPNSEQGFIILGANKDANSVDDAFGIGTDESINGIGFGDGIADNERNGMTNAIYRNLGGGSTGEPTTSADYYNSLQSKWNDGSHLMYGGNGYMSSSLESNYSFPGGDDLLFGGTGGVDPTFEWSEVSEGNPPGDRRIICSSGPFTYNLMDTLFYDICFVSGTSSTSGGYTGHESLQFHSDSARSYFASNQTPCGQDFDFYAPFNGPYPSIGLEKEVASKISIFPNPTKEQIHISGTQNGDLISLYSLSGQLINTLISSGNNEIFDLNKLHAGIYIIVISSENEVQSKKITKL